MTTFDVPTLSVLDVAPVWRGSTATQALRDCIAMAPIVERLGYHRYWVAEHHNNPSLATAATSVLVGQLAAATTTLRVGAGGVLLPNHSPYVVAEHFGALQALHPDRIDLGLGRAAGTDPAAAALLRHRLPGSADFPEQILELSSYFAPRSPDERTAPVQATAASDSRVPFWILGSSPASGVLAGRLGLPYAYAQQINAEATGAALRAYRDEFRPSLQQDRPYAILSALVVVAGTDEEAMTLMEPFLLHQFLARTTGRVTPVPRAEDLSEGLPPGAAEWIREQVGRHVVGSVSTVRDRIAQMLAEYRADEFMVMTITPDFDDRVRSFELLADAVSLPHAMA